jgi:putative YhdH/YhfP family quinone oxidoreductase
MKTFKAFRTEETNEGFKNILQELDYSILLNDEVVIKVAYSGINFKDFLSSRGNKGITRQYPHTPGIDASGIVVSDKTKTFNPGDEVVVMGYDFGMNHDGGFAEYIGVPASWVLLKPSLLTLKETMQIGTSGFTAAFGVSKILKMGQSPDQGPILVSGATGGVGTYAVQMLSDLGFEVWAMTSKIQETEMLLSLGAARIVTKEEVIVPAEKAIQRSKWAGAFDTVGGDILVSILKQCAKSGSVATCGNVAGAKLEMTVFPFILNGINLLGINSADTPMEVRKEVWKIIEKTSDAQKVSRIGKEISLNQINDALCEMETKSHKGRFTINMNI